MSSSQLPDDESMRPLAESELGDALDLIEYAFNRVPGTPEQRAEWCDRAATEEVWGYFAGSSLAATVTIVPLQVILQGQEIGMGLIAGVAAWPEHRRKGLIGKLLVRILEPMKSAGLLVSYLAPFSFSFYRRYGWEQMDDLLSCRAAIGALPLCSQTPGKVVRMEPDVNILHPIYESYARAYNGMLSRTERRWRESVLARKKGTTAVYIDEAGTPSGYLIFEISKREMNVHELAYKDDEARRALIDFVRKHDSLVDSVMFREPANSDIHSLLAEPEELERKLTPHFMARITDVPGLIRQYPFEGADAAEVSLHVHDEHAAWNDGTFTVSFNSDGSVRVEVESGRRAGGLSCEITALSTMLMGYRRPLDLYRTGQLRGCHEEVMEWEARIPTRTPCYLDFGS